MCGFLEEVQIKAESPYSKMLRNLKHSELPCDARRRCSSEHFGFQAGDAQLGSEILQDPSGPRSLDKVMEGACARCPWSVRQPGLAELVFVGATEGKRGSKWPRLAPEKGGAEGGGRGGQQWSPQRPGLLSLVELRASSSCGLCPVSSH